MIDAALLLARLLLGLAALFLMGYAWLGLVMPRLNDLALGEKAAASFALGAVLLTLWMLALAWAGAAYSLGVILVPLLGLGLLLSLTPRGRQVWRRGAIQTAGPAPKRLNAWDWLFLTLLFTLLLFTTLRAILYPMWAWDALATWGYKAKVFYLAQGMDFSRFEAHNYYPNLIPLLLTYLYFCLGQVQDALVQGVFTLWGGLTLGLLYSLSRRLGLSRTQTLGLTAFLALNGTVFITHLYIAYADLPLAFFTLGAAACIYLWLAGPAPAGSLGLAAIFMAGLAWCKYEGPPLAGTMILAAAFTLAWLRPSDLWRRLKGLSLPAAGMLAGYLPWRLFALSQGIPMGSDHVHSFYAHQLWGAAPYLAAALANPYYFGVLWPGVVLAAIAAGRRLWTGPGLFLAVFLAGNLAAVLLAYALAPTSAAEFASYVRATLDRLLLHLTPTAALFAALCLADREWLAISS